MSPKQEWHVLGEVHNSDSALRFPLKHVWKTRVDVEGHQKGQQTLGRRPLSNGDDLTHRAQDRNEVDTMASLDTVDTHT